MRLRCEKKGDPGRQSKETHPTSMCLQYELMGDNMAAIGNRLKHPITDRALIGNKLYKPVTDRFYICNGLF
jgi:hypothetical protein